MSTERFVEPSTETTDETLRKPVGMSEEDKKIIAEVARGVLAHIEAEKNDPDFEGQGSEVTK
jgi:hypothetical protein